MFLDRDPAQPVVLLPPSDAEPLELADLWHHRRLIWALARRDMKTRYRQTMLGPLWYILTPLARMGVFSIVFGTIAQLPSDGVPYPLFTYVAVLPWELLAAAVQRSTQSMIKYQGIIPKVYFPRLIVPIVESLSALPDFLFSLLLLFPMLAFYGKGLDARVCLLPFFLLLTLATGLAVGLVFASLQVRYRDANQFVAYLLQTWSFATPVAYAAALVERQFAAPLWWLYRLNPMFSVVEGFRWIFLGTGHPPDWTLFLIVPAVLYGLHRAALLFQRTQHLVVDLL